FKRPLVPRWSSRPVLTRDRLAVFSRCTAAICAGYLLAALFTRVLSLTGPLEKPDMVRVATMVSFIIHTIAIMWVFLCRNALQAGLGLLIPSLV
ncbi:hypothetical protein, partial [Acinetobacter ursingii]|uniref:hypothetical protein n=1 Tax=Acinetobacter ursingii TaxID=108980 RepID=UPI003AF8D4A4